MVEDPCSSNTVSVGQQANRTTPGPVSGRSTHHVGGFELERGEVEVHGAAGRDPHRPLAALVLGQEPRLVELGEDAPRRRRQLPAALLRRGCAGENTQVL